MPWNVITQSEDPNDRLQILAFFYIFLADKLVTN